MFEAKEKVDKSFKGMLTRKLAGKSKHKKKEKADDATASGATAGSSKKGSKGSTSKKRRGSAKVGPGDDEHDGFDDANDLDGYDEHGDFAPATQPPRTAGGSTPAADVGSGKQKFPWRFTSSRRRHPGKRFALGSHVAYT
jgi:hypothetical protein